MYVCFCVSWVGGSIIGGIFAGVGRWNKVLLEPVLLRLWPRHMSLVRARTANNIF